MPELEAPQFPIPKTLAECVDLIDKVTEERLALDRKSAVLATHAQRLKDHVVAELRAQKATGIAGTLKRLEFEMVDEPKVEDWPTFLNYCAKTGSWDMLGKKIAPAAVRARWAENQNIPGVGSAERANISITKR